MIESDINARRPGTMRNLGPSNDSFTRAQRIGLKNENFKNNHSLSSSFNSLKSSIMSVEGLSLDDLDGTELFDVFDNR